MWRGRSDGDEQPLDGDQPRRRTNPDRRRTLSDWSDDLFDAPEAGATSGRKIRRIESGPPGRKGDRSAGSRSTPTEGEQTGSWPNGRSEGATPLASRDPDPARLDADYGGAARDGDVAPLHQPTEQLPSVSQTARSSGRVGNPDGDWTPPSTSGDWTAPSWSSDDQPSPGGAIPSSLSGATWPQSDSPPVPPSDLDDWQPGSPAADRYSPSAPTWPGEPNGEQQPGADWSAGPGDDTTVAWPQDQRPGAASSPSLDRTTSRTMDRRGDGPRADRGRSAPGGEGGQRPPGGQRGPGGPRSGGQRAAAGQRAGARSDLDRKGPPRQTEKPSEPNRVLLGVAVGLVVLAGAAVAWWLLNRDDSVATTGDEVADATETEDASAEPSSPDTSAAPLAEPLLEEPLLQLNGAEGGPLEAGATYSIELVGAPPDALLEVVVGGSPKSDPSTVLPDLTFGPGRHTLSVNIDDGGTVFPSSSLEVFVLDEAPAAGFLANLASINIVSEGWDEAIRRYDEYRAAGHEGLQILPITPGFWNIFVPGLGTERAAVEAYCESFGLAVPDECFAKEFDPATYAGPETTTAPADGTDSGSEGDSMTDGATTSTTAGG